MTRRTRIIGRIAAGLLLGGGGVLALAGPASAGVGGGSGASCSGSSCTVSVSFSGTAAPPAGSPKAAATVPPDCWYERFASPQEFLDRYRDVVDEGHFSGIQAMASWGSIAEIEAAAEDPAKADWSWYMMSCRDGINPLMDPIARDYGRGQTGGGGFAMNLLSLLLPPGQNPPPPPVDVETLRDAARDAMTIPAPTVDHNPKIQGTGGATFVNLPTYFSAGTGYADTFDITASVGPVSATVVAAQPRWTLSSPAGTVGCTQQQMTAILSAATNNPCALTFSRRSAGMPVDIISTWQTSWSGVPEPAGPIALDTISATSQTVVPVIENNTIVTEVD